MNNKQFLVKKDDLHTCRFVQESGPRELVDGEIRLRIDRFGLTSNNISYAATGDALGYWHFFPVDENGWGRFPVWGFAEVVESRHAQVQPGQRVYGYLPISSGLIVRPDNVTARGFNDVIEHRPTHAPIYNRYDNVTDDSRFTPHYEALYMLLWPLFATSFLLDAFVADNNAFGGEQVILASASSRTAIGLAYLLSKRGAQKVIGLTSPGNAAFVESLGYYDHVVTYDDIETLSADKPSMLVDMSGDRESIGRIHRHFGDALGHSCAVGATHWDQGGKREPLPGPKPKFFFAPDQMQQCIEQWGTQEFMRRIGASWEQFATAADQWLDVIERKGEDAVRETYLQILDGDARSDQGYVLSLG